MQPAPVICPDELPDLRGKGPVAWDTETYDKTINTKGPGWCFQNAGFIAGISVYHPSFHAYLPIAHKDGGNMDPDRVMRWAKDQLEDPEGTKIFANAKYDIGWFRRHGIDVKGTIDDVLIAAPVLDENKYVYDLDSVALDLIGEGKQRGAIWDYAEQKGWKKKSEMMSHLWEMPVPIVGEYALPDSKVTYLSWEKQIELLKQDDVFDIYRLECDLIPLLVEMRWRGTPIDLNRIEQLRDEFSRSQKELTAEIKRLTGHEIDPWKAGTIAPVLNDLGIKIPLTPKTKKPSIKKEWLASIDHPIVKMILEVRQYDRMRGTFLENALLGHHENGVIHAEFHQLKSSNEEGESQGTVGGRFSCTDPNLQQIPQRGSLIAKKIREAFVGWVNERFVSLDYSSQEPRLMAHYAGLAGVKGGDEVVRIYNENPKTDFHQMVADMTGLKRGDAKIINLGLAYGMGGVKLCLSLGLSITHGVYAKDGRFWKRIADYIPGAIIPQGCQVREEPGPEGRALLETYHEKAPFIRALTNKASNRAKSMGFIKTILGRKCRFPLQQDGSRWFTHKAFNRLIQGSAADQTKKAMLDMWKEGIVPLIQVHDELCFSMDSGSQLRRVQQIMVETIPLLVPVVAEAKVGYSWGTANGDFDTETLRPRQAA